MDIRAIANSIIQPINGNVSVTIKRSTGFVTGAGRKQIPQYDEFTGIAQVQALDGKDLQKMEGLNMRGNLRALYFSGELHGTIRADGTGSDMVTYNGKNWLVAKVLETWPTWTKVAIVEQIDDNVCT